MKKQLLPAVILFMTFISAKAQKTDTARLLVHYKFIWVRDTTKRAYPYTENMVLYVGKNASAYRSWDGIMADAQFKKAVEGASSPDGHFLVDKSGAIINRRGAGSIIQYYQFPNEQKLFTKDNLMFNEYLIDGPMPAIDWKTSSDTATFGGLHCQKATCHFGGRDYIAWFCPDLPVHTGPWKLNGLPGVIVDAHDTKNEIVFKFDGVENAIPTPTKNTTTVTEKDQLPIMRGLNDDLNLIGTPPRTIKTTQKEFDKLKEAMEKDPQAFAEALMASNRAANARGDAPKMDRIRVAPGHGPHGPVINNPMELPEAK